MADNANRGFGTSDDEQQTGTANTSGRTAQNSGDANDLTSDDTQNLGRKGGETRRAGQQNQGGISDTNPGAGSNSGASGNQNQDTDSQNQQNS
ncbi:hypothetical protein CCAX7_56840 [Capsulimonas corticalis]|uniref:Uncharacterized protein n=1 Tax=Capsulimonas corticalis TaxID=2219043 RepID=A0A402D0G7_9BACT|nr:hypothetical protein [Capsulimonas corticalis]BDI33633.1 hypothetical protein CCAX7_56840 [Capsulimonas corticalis]